MDLIIIGIGILLVALIGLSIKIVRPTQRGLVERFGKYKGFAGQGIHFIIPLIDKMTYVNVTEQMVDAESQEIITSDNLNAKVDAQVYFKVKPSEEDVKNSQYEVDNYYIQIVALARTTLRDIIGQMPFREVNSERSKLNLKLAQELDKETSNWGIAVVRTELKEIEPPKDVQDTMNEIIKADNTKQSAIDYATAKETEADGQRRSEIKVAEGRRKASILKAEGRAEAIKLVNESAQKYFVGNAIALKKLETMENSLSNNSKFVVSSDTPIMELATKLIGLKESLEDESSGSSKTK